VDAGVGGLCGCGAGGAEGALGGGALGAGGVGAGGACVVVGGALAGGALEDDSSGCAHDAHQRAPGRFWVPQRGQVIVDEASRCISSLGRLMRLSIYRHWKSKTG
jgi:hypothetical protein